MRTQTLSKCSLCSSGAGVNKSGILRTLFEDNTVFLNAILALNLSLGYIQAILEYEIGPS
jgi:hypothetical protein